MKARFCWGYLCGIILHRQLYRNCWVSMFGSNVTYHPKRAERPLANNWVFVTTASLLKKESRFFSKLLHCFCRTVWNCCPNLSSVCLNAAPIANITSSTSIKLVNSCHDTCTLKHLQRKQVFCLKFSKFLLCFCKGSSTCRNAHTAAYFRSFNIHDVLCWNGNQTANFDWGSNRSWIPYSSRIPQWREKKTTHT